MHEPPPLESTKCRQCTDPLTLPFLGRLRASGASVLGGTVSIDSGATMQWGAGNAAFLVGSGNAVVDNGALVMDFGGGGISGSIPISGSGTLTLQSGALNDSAASTLTGPTTIDSGALMGLSGAGSFSASNVTANGTLDISLARPPAPLLSVITQRALSAHSSWA